MIIFLLKCSIFHKQLNMSTQMDLLTRVEINYLLEAISHAARLRSAARTFFNSQSCEHTQAWYEIPPEIEYW